MSARSATVAAPRSLWDALRGPGDPHSRWIRDQSSSIALDQLATGSCLGAAEELAGRCVLIAARDQLLECRLRPRDSGDFLAQQLVRHVGEVVHVVLLFRLGGRFLGISFLQE